MAEIDLFLVAGQSNAEGRGTSAQAPSVSNGSLEFSSSTLSPLADPVGGASTGSAWPAFANEYGRCAITEAAVGGTKLLTGMGGGNWSPSGSLFGDSITQAEAAITALQGAGWTVTMRGVLWSQGESEGELYAGSDLIEAYSTALAALPGRFQVELGDQVQVWVARTGRLTSGDTPRWAEVREAQDIACASTDGLHMAYVDTINFPDLGWMKVDGIHYSQAGLNAMGAAMGAYVRNHLAVPSTLLDVNGDPVVQYQRIDGEPVEFTDAATGVH